MEVPDVRYAISDGYRIAWQQWGSGPDVLVVPPFTSNVELVWEQELYRRALEYYGEHIRVTAFDNGASVSLTGSGSRPRLRTGATTCSR